MRTSTMICALGSVLATAALGGCSGDDAIEGKLPGVETGTLEQNWTIEGAKDVNQCQQHRADRMRIVVLDAKGGVHATEFAPCNDFHKSLVLKTDV